MLRVSQLLVTVLHVGCLNCTDEPDTALRCDLQLTQMMVYRGSRRGMEQMSTQDTGCTQDTDESSIPDTPMVPRKRGKGKQKVPFTKLGEREQRRVLKAGDTKNKIVSMIRTTFEGCQRKYGDEDVVELAQLAVGQLANKVHGTHGAVSATVKAQTHRTKAAMKRREEQLVRNWLRLLAVFVVTNMGITTHRCWPKVPP
jgi:hypothetical protein